MITASLSEQQKALVRWLGTGSINLLGMPFAGKDTQGKRLAEKLSAEFISSGDILRHHALPVPDKLALDHGDLLPATDYLQLILPYLARPELSNKALVLSAVGHQNGEADAVLSATARAGHPTKAVVYLRIEEEIGVARWRHLAKQDDRHRADDRPAKVTPASCASSLMLVKCWKKAFKRDP